MSHKGCARKACGFQLTQLLAQLFALRQHGDVVLLAQRGGLAQHGREVGVLAVQQGDLLLCTGDLVALLQQDAAHPLEADGESHGGHLYAKELAHHVVVASTAGHSTAELRAGHLEHHAGVVTLTAQQTGAVGHLVAAGSQRVGGSQHILQVVGNGGVGAAGGYGVQRHVPGGDEVGQCLDGTFRQLLLGQLGLHALGTDFVHLVKGDEDGIQRVGGKAHALQHPAQDAAVINVDGKAGKADVQQSAGSHVDQFHLGVGGGVTQNVDIALHELPQTALLGALSAEHPVGLDDLEGVGQLVLVGGVVAAQRQGEVVAQTHVGQLLGVAGVQGSGQLITALEHLEDQVQVVAALGFVQIFHILQHGGGDPLKTGSAVGLQNLALNVIAQGLFGGQQVPHTLQSLCFHNSNSSLSVNCTRPRCLTGRREAF